MQIITKESKQSQRHTIVIDSEIESILKELQTYLIEAQGKSCSLSHTVNLLLLGGIIASDKLTPDDWSILRFYHKRKKIRLDQTLQQNWHTNLFEIELKNL